MLLFLLLVFVVNVDFVNVFAFAVVVLVFIDNHLSYWPIRGVDLLAHVRCRRRGL